MGGVSESSVGREVQVGGGSGRGERYELGGEEMEKWEWTPSVFRVGVVAGGLHQDVPMLLPCSLLPAH